MPDAGLELLYQTDPPALWPSKAWHPAPLFPRSPGCSDTRHGGAPRLCRLGTEDVSSHPSEGEQRGGGGVEECPETPRSMTCLSPCLLSPGCTQTQEWGVFGECRLRVGVLRVMRPRAPVPAVLVCVCVSLRCILIAGPSWTLGASSSVCPPALSCSLSDCLSISVTDPLAHLGCVLNCFPASCKAASPAVHTLPV